jgi:hypothetical protein
MVRQNAARSLFEDASKAVDSTIDWNTGDLLYFDGATDLIKPVASDATGATILGIARQTLIDGKPRGPYTGLTAVDAAVAVESIAGPLYGVEANMKLKSADVFAHGDLIYATAVDAQTVSSAGVNPIGIYVDSPVTAGATSEGRCLIGARLNSTLLM